MLGHYMDLNKDLNTVLAEPAVQSTGEIQTCKITYYIHQKNSLHDCSLPLLASGLTAQ